MRVYENGCIEVENEVMVSDPCYKPGAWGQSVVKNMLPGQYVAGAEVLEDSNGENRVSKIWIRHKDYYSMMSVFVRENSEIGVDSGQAGIYNLQYYLDVWKQDKPTAWYSRVCNATYTEAEQATFDVLDNKCIVSASGGVGGCYLCNTVCNQDGKVIYVEIDYGINDEFDNL